jgi:hypothetical protein
MAGIKGNKAHANKTTFTSESQKGNKNSEYWTFERAERLFNEASQLARDENNNIVTFIDIVNYLDDDHDQKIYSDLFRHLSTKFPDFAPQLFDIKQNLANKIFKKALFKDYNPIMAKFGLINKHNWKEKLDIVNQKIKNDEAIKIEIIKASENKSE